MAKDKGITRKKLLFLRKYREFNSKDMNGDSGFLDRCLRYGIAERLSPGKYRVIVDDPLKAYYFAANHARQGGRKSREIATVPREISREIQSPRIAVVPLPSGADLIVIGKRQWLGEEIAFTPKNRRGHGD